MEAITEIGLSAGDAAKEAARAINLLRENGFEIKADMDFDWQTLPKKNQDDTMSIELIATGVNLGVCFIKKQTEPLTCESCKYATKRLSLNYVPDIWLLECMVGHPCKDGICKYYERKEDQTPTD